MWSQRKTGNSLTAKAATGAGTTVDFGPRVVKSVRYYVKTAAISSGTATIKIEASLDGVTWYPTATSLSITATGNQSAQINGPGRYWRANVTAYATDGNHTVDLEADSAF